MIDTDKYEGHTPAPWTNEYDEELGEHTIESHDGMIAQRVLGVDADLIADAPLLLAEVKRLRQLYYEQLAETRRLRDAYSAIHSMVENQWRTFLGDYS